MRLSFCKTRHSSYDTFTCTNNVLICNSVVHETYLVTCRQLQAVYEQHSMKITSFFTECIHLFNCIFLWIAPKVAWITTCLFPKPLYFAITMVNHSESFGLEYHLVWNEVTKKVWKRAVQELRSCPSKAWAVSDKTMIKQFSDIHLTGCIVTKLLSNYFHLDLWIVYLQAVTFWSRCQENGWQPSCECYIHLFI